MVDRDLIGLAVTVAFRILELAQPGEVLVTSDVAGIARGLGVVVRVARTRSNSKVCTHPVEVLRAISRRCESLAVRAAWAYRPRRMSGFMPYLLDKGPYFSVIESKLADPATRAQALRRSPQQRPDRRPRRVRLDESRGGRPHRDAAQAASERGLVRHRCADVLVRVRRQSRDDPARGDASARSRCRSGSSTERPVPTDAQAASGRHWPIDLYWICQGPWFQCWVLWRRAEQGQGHVTLVITTPAAAGFPLTSKITRPINPRPPAYTAPDYAHPPEAARTAASRRASRRASGCSGTRTTRASWFRRPCTRSSEIIRLPVMGWSAVDPTKVECVSPAEWEGGVLDVPRPYHRPPSPE